MFLAFFLFVLLIFFLALNAFYVLAEFSIVKIRESLVATLVDSGNKQARVLQNVQQNLDEYLGVCQIGITFASIALGMVGKKLTDLILGNAPPYSVYGIAALLFSYIVVSGSHIVLGELIPKSLAIRLAEKTALLCAYPLYISRQLFYVPLWFFNYISEKILALFGVPRTLPHEIHSEEELRHILDESQEHGVMSFKRLLIMENIFDFGDLLVRDAMRRRASVKVLSLQNSWEENLSIIRATRFSRYPILDGENVVPRRFLHVKDIVLYSIASNQSMWEHSRPLVSVSETARLEQVLSDMQKRYFQFAAVVNDAGEWIGVLSAEDIIEEIIGVVRDEFEEKDKIYLSDILYPENIFLDISAACVLDAVAFVLQDAEARGALEVPASEILRAVEVRENQMETYLGNGIAMPHARLLNIKKSMVFVMRSSIGIPCRTRPEKVHLIFFLITPTGEPKTHQRLQASIATFLQESEYVLERLLEASSVEDFMNIVRVAENTVLS